MNNKQRATDLIKIYRVIKENETEIRIMKNRREELIKEVQRMNELIKMQDKYVKELLDCFSDSLTFSTAELISAYAMVKGVDESKLIIDCVSDSVIHVNKERINELKASNFGKKVNVTIREDFSKRSVSPDFKFDINRKLLNEKSIEECFDIIYYQMKNGDFGCYLKIKPECEKDLQIVINPEQVKEFSPNFINALIAISMNGAQQKVKKAPTV